MGSEMCIRDRHSAVTEAKSKDIRIVRSHSSSASSLNAVLQEYVADGKAC